MGILYNNFYFSNNEKLNNKYKLEKLPTLINLRTSTTDFFDPMLMHTHKLLEVFYFFEGTGVLKTNENEVEIVPHTFIIVNANKTHCNLCLDKNIPLKFHSLFIDDVELENLPLNSLSLNDAEVYKFSNSNNAFYKYLTNIFEEINGRNYGSQQKIQSLFYEFIIDTIRLNRDSFKSTDNDNVPDFIKKVKNYIDKNYLDDITLSFLSKMFFLSKEYLCKKFNSVYGLSPMKYLSHVRIEQSKLLLETSNVPISEIASSSGFNNPAYFSEQFKKFVGETPKSYTKKFRAKS